MNAKAWLKYRGRRSAWRAGCLLGGSRAKSWRDVGGLLLAIEVLSPSTAQQDRVKKRRLFAGAGVPEYWIVDPEVRVIERWRPGDDLPELCNKTLVWHPAGASAPLVLDLPALFRTALGD